MTGRSEAAEIISDLRATIASARENGISLSIHTPSPADIRRLRAEYGMSQSEFAAHLGVSETAVRTWERE